MKPEAQRVAIAEFCGWKAVRFEGANCYGIDNPKAHHAKTVPDYLNDLNAMHEAEMRCFETPTERLQYLCNLENVASRTREVAEDYTMDPVTQWACFATAAQRAEALLRTIGKWEEE